MAVTNIVLYTSKKKKKTLARIITSCFLFDRLRPRWQSQILYCKKRERKKKLARFITSCFLFDRLIQILLPDDRVVALQSHDALEVAGVPIVDEPIVAGREKERSVALELDARNTSCVPIFD